MPFLPANNRSHIDDNVVVYNNVTWLWIVKKTYAAILAKLLDLCTVNKLIVIKDRFFRNMKEH